MYLDKKIDVIPNQTIKFIDRLKPNSKNGKFYLENENLGINAIQILV